MGDGSRIGSCTSTRAKPDGVRFRLIGDGDAALPSFPACVADGRQHHALAAPVTKAATRFAALTDPVRFAPTTADARRHDAGAFMFNPSGEVSAPDRAGAPVFNHQEKPMSLAFASAPLSVLNRPAPNPSATRPWPTSANACPCRCFCSAAGHYIGTADADGPVSRGESVSYFRSHHAAEHAPETGRWQQRLNP